MSDTTDYPNTRAIIPMLPRREGLTVRMWFKRGVPRIVKMLVEYEELYHALKSDLASDDHPHS